LVVFDIVVIECIVGGVCVVVGFVVVEYVVGGAWVVVGGVVIECVVMGYMGCLFVCLLFDTSINIT